MADNGCKRKASNSDSRDKKRQKGQWKGHDKRKSNSKEKLASGDSGIFVSCDRGREGKCSAEILDLLSQEVPSVDPDQKNDSTGDENENDEVDIEEQIKREVELMQPKRSKAPFRLVSLDVPCLIFVKSSNTLNPVDIVHRLCIDARTHPERKRSRWVKRLTPITSMRKILGGGLEELARDVLKPHFHSGGPPRKYAIRPTIRNNTDCQRDSVIKLIAGIVGSEHSVDLKNYDLLILVDVIQTMCGMSVVEGDYDELKRYNLSEIYSPTPRPEVKPERGPEDDEKVHRVQKEA
ncbi:THUMP domain-containing protein [Nannizzia gypsea CBS 118893]|uniref:THUMP domain-containing protein n=1 Tax=Arthroderma gypseum (strain ATCC MYA-4604 / CBS 118893) TaxID=535722 RepID=E5QZA7_ARTGP|nr:THUMP domain-containing protein [Nannizzia gypsea CBS 118893]EFQ98125.1 THUMP domain-containing protein [Nannizzia gypsea CBS 118893]